MSDEIDILLYVALGEEFNSVMTMLGDEFKSRERYADGKADGVIQFHSPTHPKVEEKRRLLRETLGRPGLVIQDWNYPGPETDEADSWFQAWLLAQLQVLDKADAVVALGGKVSKTANTLLHLAEAKGLPIVSFSFLGGRQIVLVLGAIGKA